ncbi:DNA repair protein RAD51 homolog 4 isoform X3 [Nymphaea colorata]|uniref:DNA repair protein RAD51 homolog 4 isoform X3 n=1 Tax=Nymphaea colorata TaxID=210225 RepID=UPI00129DF70A|nr:DNA repair protein RAD51 homolog 4 isoform X3 [Nymphaea colorata]
MQDAAQNKGIYLGITQVLSIIDSQHQPWLNGIDLLEDQQNKHVLSTGLEGIDSLLEGGFCEGKFIELVGSSSSGKTQVCLAAAAYIAHKYMCTVMFLDTCSSFSSKRIACHVNGLLELLQKEDKERCFKRVMNSILCRPVLDLLELSKVLHQIESTLASQVKGQHTKMRLLIVDSVSSLIAPILGRNSTGHSAMVSIGYLLKKLAIEYNIAVLVTNHMVVGERGILRPALGESWKRMPHIRLLLSREPGNNICTVSILKHTSLVFLSLFLSLSLPLHLFLNCINVAGAWTNYDVRFSLGVKKKTAAFEKANFRVFLLRLPSAVDGASHKDGSQSYAP